MHGDVRSITGWVYFIGAYEADELRFIKIGYTSRRNPNVRLDEVSSGIPHATKLLTATPGSMELESLYHEEFAKWRVRGEWFRPSGEIMCRVDTILAMPGSWKPGFARASKNRARRKRKVSDGFVPMTDAEREERFREVSGINKILARRAQEKAG